MTRCRRRFCTASYRDGTGFADRTSEYVTDEVAYQDVIDNIPPGTGTLASKLQATLSDPKYLGLVQHYAIPGSLRCVQCHQGSQSRNFVLGFTPLQIAQRAAQTGGVYEPVGADELNQLQRLIDYGVITGIDSPADVVPLEESQLPRVARTPQELTAQAYMIGNCAHCHNPRGYPSIAKPDLATALNFLPRSAPDVEDASAPCGRTVAGIFEFCFERMSPIRSRGASQDVPFPYITPSLRDYPVADTDMIRVDNGALLTPDSTGLPAELTWSPKYYPPMEDSLERYAARLFGRFRRVRTCILSRPEDWPVLRGRALAQPHLSQRRHAVPVLRRLCPVPAHATEHRRLRLPGPAHHGQLDGGLARACSRRPIKESAKTDCPAIGARTEPIPPPCTRTEALSCATEFLSPPSSTRRSPTRK